MNLSERINSVYEELTAKGASFKNEDGTFRPLTKADARDIIESEDARNEKVLLERGVVKASYGTLKVGHRNARTARNPRDPQADPINVPAQDVLKISTGKEFHGKLNPQLAAK